MLFIFLPQVCSQVKFWGKRPVADDRGARARGRQLDRVCSTVPDGHFQLVPEVDRVPQVGDHAELQLALWWHLPLAGLDAPKGLPVTLRKHKQKSLCCHVGCLCLFGSAVWKQGHRNTVQQLLLMVKCDAWKYLPC